MNREEAVVECRRWLAHLERQQVKAKRMQELAALARTGPKGHEEARREMNRIDGQPEVYDGARLSEAVQVLIEEDE